MGETIHRDRSERRTQRTVDDDTIRKRAGSTAVKGANETAASADAFLDDIDALLEEEVVHERDLDALMKEIDEVLVTNPQEYVDQFVQRGGQ